MTHHVFISYSIEDKVVAEKILVELEQQNITCWIAPRDIPYGQNYAASIVSGIKNCAVFVLVFTSSSNKSKHVLYEIDVAFENEKNLA